MGSAGHAFIAHTKALSPRTQSKDGGYGAPPHPRAGRAGQLYWSRSGRRREVMAVRRLERDRAVISPRLFPQPDIRTAIRFAIVRGLAETPTSAQLRAALYRVLATTPGIRLLGRTRDSIGRSGIALAVNVQDAELEMIIDPTTGQLLQTSRTLLHRSKAYLDGRQPPGLIVRDTYLATGIVSSTNTQVR
jgi:hypothetical protein